MKKPAASDPHERPEKSRGLTLALAFGFATGALLARRPAAALTALATGVLTCLGASRNSEPTEEEATEPPDATPGPENQVAAMIEVPPGPSLDENPPAAAPEVCDASDELEPLPEIGILPEPEPTNAADELLSLSLPEVGGQAVPADEPPAPASFRSELDSSKGHESPSSKLERAPSPELAPAATIARKRSWMEWFR